MRFARALAVLVRTAGSILLVVGCGDDSSSVQSDMTATTPVDMTTSYLHLDMFAPGCATCLQERCDRYCYTTPPLTCGRCVHNVTLQPDGGRCDFPVYGCGSCSAFCPEF